MKKKKIMKLISLLKLIISEIKEKIIEKLFAGGQKPKINKQAINNIANNENRIKILIWE